MIELLHYRDSIILSEPVTCSAIEIKYKGKFIGESKLADNWYVGTGRNKILCISLTGDSEVTELFEFAGSFAIIGARIITQELEEITPNYKILDIDLFSVSEETFENGGSYFSDYNSRHLPIDTIEDTDIYKNNLFTEQNEFYYDNGDNYFGEYHQHSNGQAMTESIHNADSVNIYRKDQNNKLLRPKAKRLAVVTDDDMMNISRDKDAKIKVFKGQSSKTIMQSESGGAGGGGGSGGSGGSGGY
tara:strand:- start:1056 stop:1790 length:735 start_codon:yes stop_codon:yes gene_type:complete